MKRYVIKNRMRFLVSVSLIMIFIVSSFFSLVVSAKGSNEVSLITEYVEEGDTIWGMSVNYAGKMDIREYISRVMDINNLHSANIKPGDLLYFPEYN
ncbi:MAG: hypothetical protein APF77_02470 [Clostridia bacterium BRH_c25]|nr:MAG: hypothetical protein APF77_02470 [Clostridia bacterium BRH_c25]